MFFLKWDYVKQVTAGWGYFLSQSYSLNNLGRGLLDEALYQITESLGVLVWDKKTFKVFSRYASM